MFECLPDCASSHIALTMPNESATPMPRIQLKYHMIRFLSKEVDAASGRCHARSVVDNQYIECWLSSSACGVTLPRITRYTQAV